MSKNNEQIETVIDFSKLPTSLEDVKFDVDFTSVDDEDKVNQKKKKQKNVKKVVDNLSDTDDVDDTDQEVDRSFTDEIELEFEEEASDEESDEEISSEKEEQAAQEKAKKEQQDREVERRSRAQERIVELARKNKEALEAQLKTEEENKRLQQELIEFKKRSADVEVQVAEERLTKAKVAYAKAYDDGDAVAIAEANAAISQASTGLEIAKAKKNQTINLKFDEEDYTKRVTQTQQQLAQQQTYQQEQEAPDIDVRAQDWLKRNKFIFANQQLTETASILFDQLKEDGYSEKDYDLYEQLEERIVALYPQTGILFKRKVKGQQDELEEKQPAEQKKKEAPPVANANRTTAQPSTQRSNYQVDSKGKVRYKPTKDDVDMAKRMGVPLEAYVKSKLRLEQNESSGSKYTQIF